MAEALTDAPGWLDVWMIVLVVLAALGQYVALAFDGSSIARWLLALGWTGILWRFNAVEWWTNDGLKIPLVSVVCLMLIAGGTALLAAERIVERSEMKSVLHNLLGKIWRWLGVVLQKTKKWDKTP